MKRATKIAYTAAGIGAAAGLFLTIPGQASAATYTYTAKNDFNEGATVEFYIETFDEKNVLQSSAGPFSVASGQSKQWLQTNDGGHIHHYTVSWTAKWPADPALTDECHTTAPWTYKQDEQTISPANERKGSMECDNQ